jgi:hypothetical protein
LVTGAEYGYRDDVGVGVVDPEQAARREYQVRVAIEVEERRDGAHAIADVAVEQMRLSG